MDLSHLPKEKDKGAGLFFAELVTKGDEDKELRGLTDRWYYNHQMYRGIHWGVGNIKTKIRKMVMNLTFANIQRTVANLTAKEPTVRASVSRGEAASDVERVMSAWCHKWWNDTDQTDTLVDSATEMEIYGTTIEKAFLCNGVCDIAVVDPFAFGIAPGVYDTIQNAPYVYHKASLRKDQVEKQYGVSLENNAGSDPYDKLGEKRQESVIETPVAAGSIDITTSNTRAVKRKRSDNVVVTEIWIHDSNIEKYPDGIRVVTIVEDTGLILADRRNPNINWQLYEENPDAISKTYMWGRFPFEIATSYRDKTSNWGFSAIEQTADINSVMNEIVTRLYAYISRSMMPVLILPRDTGISLASVNNKPGLILRPASSNQAAAVRYMEPPRVSLDVYRFLDLIRGFFDQVWHIEDADRGERPSGIIAAEAIRSLQERNAVLMRSKIRSIDRLVKARGAAAISFLQNFGCRQEVIDIGDDEAVFSGVELIEHSFDFIVESGSTIEKTTDHLQQSAVELYRLGAIDRQAILEIIDFPKWKAIIERTGENQVDQALQILVDAGLSEEEAQAVKEYVMQPDQKEEQ